MTEKYFLKQKTEVTPEMKTWKLMERIRFHPESCKWVKKKISEFERKKRKKERRRMIQGMGPDLLLSGSRSPLDYLLASLSHL